MKRHFIIGQIETPAGSVNQISTVWCSRDVIDTIKIRWSIGRNHYAVKPGLYAIGNPDKNASVFVTANYKLSFDHLRRALHGLNAWMLVLDTKGVNVWCAAGKGTFGTRELVYRIKAHELHKIVAHKRIIVPQLGATGVSAHEVKAKSGFHVFYGPVRADDIKAYVAAGNKATADMRRVKFPMKERVKLIPVELTYGKYYLIIVPIVFFLLSGLNSRGYSVDLAWMNGGKAIVNLLGAYMAGCVLTPLFLPWIPFSMFSLKGLFMGWLAAALLTIANFTSSHVAEMISWFLIMGGLSSFLAMNFTGASTFTSLSGVQKEMKFSLPFQLGFAGLGFIGWIITRFIY
jgi:hypothetical protein